MLDCLESEGLQSDERYTESYVNSRMRRGFGPLRIKMELQERGVPTDLVGAYIDFHDEVWLEIALREYAKKFSQHTPVTLKDRAKQTRFLQSRGFTGDIIQKTLDTFTRH